MADFDPPFADDAELRVPTADERENGFPCGPADRFLFNALFNLLEGNIKHMADQAGETPNQDLDHTLLFRSIAAYVASIIGETSGGDTSNFVLMTQARARLPIHFEILNTDATIVCISTGVGNVRLPGGVDFMHRGIGLITTAQTDFVTDASKTYHLRWNPTDGFQLKDVVGGVYNPGALAETNVAFDSNYDDMLVARVITNAGNVPTITNLVNKAILKKQATVSGAGTKYGANGFYYVGTWVQNWARTPMVMFNGSSVTSGGVNYVEGWINRIVSRVVTRYTASARVDEDRYNPILGAVTGEMDMLAVA